jgi:hypothetical protein
MPGCGSSSGASASCVLWRRENAVRFGEGSHFLGRGLGGWFYARVLSGKNFSSLIVLVLVVVLVPDLGTCLKEAGSNRVAQRFSV